MAKSKKVVEPVGAGTPTEKPAGALVVTPGVGAELWNDTGSVFVPGLQRDMPLAERREVVRDTMRKALHIDDKLNLIAGELLYEASENDYWKQWAFKPPGERKERPFRDFAEYCEFELGWKKRKAYYLIDIYRTFVIDLAIPVEFLRELEWTKARELAGADPIITKKNWKELLTKIRGMSLREVRTMASKMRSKGSAGGGSADVMHRLTAMLSDAQQENVEMALEIAKGMSGSDKIGHQLDLVCSEFLAGSAAAGADKTGALLTLDIARKNLERAFGVTLEVKSVDPDRYKGVGKGSEKK